MRKVTLLITALIILGISAAAVYANTPNGAAVNLGPQERGPSNATPENATAAGGNVTPMNISAATITEAWHGFFGQVSGNITLEDAAGNMMYSWPWNASQGEVFASRSAAVTWATIAAENDCTTDEALTGTGSDRVNNTFTPNSNTGFSVGTIPIAPISACATNTYVNSTPQAVTFEEVILDDSVNSVYTALLEQDSQGFDNGLYDFQLIVPDNRTAAVVTYYFYAELS